MKRFFFVFFILLCTPIFSFAKITLLDPLPDSKYVSLYNTILINCDNTLSQSDLNGLSIKVQGSKSGNITGELIFSTDNKSLIFKPTQPFLPNEKITVTIVSASQSLKYNYSNEFNFSFFTEAKRHKVSFRETLQNETGIISKAPIDNDNSSLPKLVTNIYNNPSKGKLFLSNFPTDKMHLLIAENNADIYHSIPVKSSVYDFKVQNNGTLTYFSTGDEKFYQLDKNYNLIDSFSTGNGYTTDGHELIILDNGHALLMSYDRQIVDMSQIVPGGAAEALVTGLIIQELDIKKNVVFQWRSWDHFQITDATFEDLTLEIIDYCHGNAIEKDNDGNLLISSRNMDEITKIDRISGNIMWRLGGKNNQFTFVNDQDGFYKQHDIRRISNGNVTLFDNGNHHIPPYSRALEYNLDEENKIATMVWNFKNNPDIYGRAMGNVQRLENGNTIIGWGLINPNVSEVTSSGQVELEMSLPTGQWSYRAFKFDWDNSVSVENNTTLPYDYSLSQNYPNPFNPATLISFSIPKAENVTIKVYDTMGRELSQLVGSYLQAGKHNVNFVAEGLPSGVYIYKMQAGEFTASKKMMLIK